MTNKRNISGSLLSSSHLFYLCKDSKVFLIRLQTELEKEVYILCSLSPSLSEKTREVCRRLLLDPPLNKTISITNLKTVQISKKIKQTVLQLSKSSSIHIQEGSLVENITLNRNNNLGKNNFMKNKVINFKFSVLQGCCDFM